MTPRAIESITPYIGGKFRRAPTPVTFASVDPAAEVRLAEVQIASANDVDDAVTAARRAFDRGEWSRMPTARRSQLLYDVAAVLEAQSAEIAEIETRDTGMPITMTRGGHLPRAAAHFRHFADEAERNMGESYPVDDAYTYIVGREPIGVVAIFAPWNAPLAVATINVAAALAFGNTCVLKPSEHSPLSAHILARIFAEVGFPDGVLNVIHGPGEPTGRALAAHPSVDMIAFVGGTDTGRAVMRAASSRLARMTMELGGKSPAIVFSDADLEKAVDGILLSTFSSNGEVCTASSRIFIARPVYQDVVDALVGRALGIRVGDPLYADTEMGPLISQEHRATLAHKVRLAVDSGAQLLCGGRRPEQLETGYYFSPTILGNVRNDAEIAQQELFGPVALVMPFDSEEEAIELANATEYGLAAYVWSSSAEKALRVSRRIRAGTVAINSVVIRDIRVPFGGFKQSGIGRVGGRYSREQFTEVKTTCLPISPYVLPRLGVSGGFHGRTGEDTDGTI
jgi:acyl-CoA reductase-like NAD-dependent aldehyde dehydrogenase